MKIRQNFLTSPNFTIFLLILLALTSIVGTVVPQNLAEFEYLSRYSADSYRRLKALGIFDIYHSWWFIGLLFLLCLNLIICTIKNFPRLKKSLFYPNIALSDAQLKNLPFTTSIKTKNNPSKEEVKKIIFAVLNKFFPSRRELADPKGEYFFGEKYRYSRAGFFLTHLSIIIILLGGLIGSLWGIKGRVQIFAGETVNRIQLSDGSSYPLGFEVKCDNFEITYYPDGTPRDYKTTLTIREKGGEQFTKMIRVNHPLKYRGFAFYQENFGEIPEPTGEIILRVRKRGSQEEGKVFVVREGESFSLPDSNRVVKVNRFFSDFIRNENGDIFNRSFELHNPALELLVYKGDKLEFQTWVFQRFPDFHGSRGEYQFLIEDIKKKVYTGLQVNHDPGVPVVWMGCGLIVFGIFITFFFSHQQIWIRIKEQGNNLEIIIAGTASKNRIAFKKSFEQIKAEIDRNL